MAEAFWNEPRPVSSLPLPPFLQKKLQQCGIGYLEDLQNSTPLDLSRETGISLLEAQEVLLHVPSFSKGYSEALIGAKSARQLLHEEEERPNRISTMCAQLDDILGGGIPSCELTEICGAPGIGKTQLCMQLALSVQMPKSLGGAGGQAVYIDTEGSFMTERAVQMAEGMSKELKERASQDGDAAEQHRQRALALPNALDSSSDGKEGMGFGGMDLEGMAEQPLSLDQGQALPTRKDVLGAEVVAVTQPQAVLRWSPSPEDLLRSIHFFRVLSSAEQMAVCNMLPAFLEAHPQVRLIILDSVSFQFRQNLPDKFQRTRTLLTLGQQLLSLAHAFNVAVVLSNHVTTKVVDGMASLAPALGEGWSHTSTNRVILFWKDSCRYAYILKSPYLPPATAPFFVTRDGIRGEDEETGNKRLRLEQ